MPKISIIVPCYNVAQWLPRCLNSLVNQTLSDIEILVIDDKSTDDSLAVLQEYEKQDKRIRVFAHDRNQGVAVARNTGLAAATGEYIGFVDPDDYIDLDFYEVLYKKSLTDNADIIKGNQIRTDLNGNEYAPNLNERVSKDKFNFSHSFWSAIYKKSFLDKHSLKFPDNIITSQDVVFLAKCVFLANQVVVVNNTSYRYFKREGSLDSAILSPIKLQSKIDGYKTLLLWMNEQPNMTDDDYKSMLWIVCNLSTYPVGKETSNGDRLKLCNGFVWLYDNVKNPEWIRRCYGEKTFNIIKSKNISKIYEKFYTKIIKVRLFGLIPLLKIYKLPDGQQTILFANLLPIFRKSISENKTKIFVLGILLFKIKI